MKHYHHLTLLALLLTFIACSPTVETKIIQVTQPVPETVIVTQIVTQEVTRIVERIITATPIPATLTPTSPPAPIYQKLSAWDVINSFKDAGLEAENPHEMTKEDYGLAPYVAIEGVRFLIPSICADCGGRALSFASQADLELSKAYYDELGRQSAIFFSWTFVKDNVLVQINGDLPEVKALEYAAILSNLK